MLLGSGGAAGRDGGVPAFLLLRLFQLAFEVGPAGRELPQLDALPVRLRRPPGQVLQSTEPRGKNPAPFGEPLLGVAEPPGPGVELTAGGVELPGPLPCLLKQATDPAVLGVEVLAVPGRATVGELPQLVLEPQVVVARVEELLDPFASVAPAVRTAVRLPGGGGPVEHRGRGLQHKPATRLDTTHLDTGCGSGPAADPDTGCSTGRSAGHGSGSAADLDIGASCSADHS
ncbi:hypothetical protein ACFPIJ_50300, partial [Dactylosporangium cerinum]